MFLIYSALSSGTLTSGLMHAFWRGSALRDHRMTTELSQWMKKMLFPVLLLVMCATSAHAVDTIDGQDFPLRPPDRSTPAASLQAFIEAGDAIGTLLADERFTPEQKALHNLQRENDRLAQDCDDLLFTETLLQASALCCSQGPELYLAVEKSFWVTTPHCPPHHRDVFISQSDLSNVLSNQLDRTAQD